MTTETMYRKFPTRRFSVGATIVAAFLFLIELTLLFSKPSIGIAGHTIFVSQGMAAFAVLIGALFWAIAEMFTPAGQSIWDLAMRFGFSFVLGAIFGGFLGYTSNFGELVLIPAYNGNPLALFMIAGYLWVFLVLVLGASWMHSRNFIKRGGKA